MSILASLSFFDEFILYLQSFSFLSNDIINYQNHQDTIKDDNFLINKILDKVSKDFSYMKYFLKLQKNLFL